VVAGAAALVAFAIGIDLGPNLSVTGSLVAALGALWLQAASLQARSRAASALAAGGSGCARRARRDNGACHLRSRPWAENRNPTPNS